MLDEPYRLRTVDHGHYGIVPLFAKRCASIRETLRSCVESQEFLLQVSALSRATGYVVFISNVTVTRCPIWASPQCTV